MWCQVNVWQLVSNEKTPESSLLRTNIREPELIICRMTHLPGDGRIDIDVEQNIKYNRN